MNERVKRLIQDGESIGRIAEFEIDSTLEENELYLKSLELDKLDQKVLAHLYVAKVTRLATISGVAPKIVPALLRIVANSVDLMLQNVGKDKQN